MSDPSDPPGTAAEADPTATPDPQGIGAPQQLMESVPWMRRLVSIHATLGDSASVAELFARTSELTRRELGLDRAIVLCLDGTWLTARALGPLPHAADDQLRRRVGRAPVQVSDAEARWLREQGTTPASLTATVRDALELRHAAVAPIVAGQDAVALLVADRPDPPAPGEGWALEALGAVVALALEHVARVARMTELRQELQMLAVSAMAMTAEVADAPLTIPSEGRHGPTFPRVGFVPEAVEEQPADILTPRESEVADLIAQGCSNREIAERLVLSPETVKHHVRGLLRKLNATNRAEAVARLGALGRGH
ncbi:MAG: LuxR C-terminal-related transcriptional regulator [Solirubrobacteraceae bacterium]|nr:LuxR C-terminal-related transcriptional regulator [Solirubrobacteraceae bacterium]